MLAYTSINEKTMQLLLAHLQDFLKCFPYTPAYVVHDLFVHIATSCFTFVFCRFMTKNASKYIQSSDYVLAPPEYHRKAL